MADVPYRINEDNVFNQPAGLPPTAVPAEGLVPENIPVSSPIQPVSLQIQPIEPVPGLQVPPPQAAAVEQSTVSYPQTSSINLGQPMDQTVVYAGFGRRFLATIIDGFVVGLIEFAIMFSTGLVFGLVNLAGVRIMLGVMMRFFSARLIAELRLDGIVSATRVKYRMNAELVRFDRERTRALLSETADRRIEMLISNFSLFDDGKRKLLTSVQKREQVRSIVANLAGWSKELREDVKVKPYKASVTMVAIRFIGGSFSRNDQERWEKILGEEGVRKALGERIIPLFGTGREEDYQKARQLLVDSQALLRKILEEHKDIYPEKS